MRGLSTCLLVIACSLASLARGQAPPLTVPRLEQCGKSSHPSLPERWHATFLSAPFTNSQLVLSDIVHDQTLSSTHVKLYGLRGGSMDLLVQGTSTFLLSRQGSAPACENLGDTGWRPMPLDWLAPTSRCVGSAPLGNTQVDWWKTPIEPAPATYWIWTKGSDGSPVRLAFSSPSGRLGALSEFALDYQIRFEPVSETGLAEVAKPCAAAAKVRSQNPARTLRDRIASMQHAGGRADAEIGRLFPELAACPSAPLPVWPETLAMTGLMTPWDANENPHGTEVLYDWRIRAQRTRILFEDGAVAALDALLRGPRGYNVTHHRDRAQGPACAAVLPGTVQPDWASRAPCTCEAMITGTTPLSPHGPVQVLTCPLASPRAAWAWYGLDGRPLSFAVTSRPGDQGLGLFAVLDYRDWLPGRTTPRSAFDRPETQCHGPPASTPIASNQCTTCHLGNSTHR